MSALTMPKSAYGQDQVGGPPQVVSAIEGAGEVMEGDAIHLEFRVMHSGDLQDQWFKDGHPLSAGKVFV